MARKQQELTFKQIRKVLEDLRGLTPEIIDRIIIFSQDYVSLRMRNELLNLHMVARCFPQNTAKAVNIMLDALDIGTITEFTDGFVEAHQKAFALRKKSKIPHDPLLLSIELLEYCSPFIQTTRNKNKRMFTLKDL